MHLRKILLLLLFSLEFAVASMKFSHINIAEGLPGTIIREIIQDADGYMWFGTKYGLAKYDGYNVEIINDKNGDSLGDIWALTNDRDGSILIASKARGLFRYKHGHLESLDVFKESEGIKVYAIGLDANGILWVGTNEGTYKVKNNIAKKLRSFEDEKSYSFLDLDNNHILVQTNRNIHKYNIETENKETIEIYPQDQESSYYLHKDVYGKIWLGRTNGLYLLDEKCQCFKRRFKELTNIKVYSLISDKKYLWIGTIRNDLYRYSYETFELLRITHENDGVDGLNDSTIYSLYIDKSKVIWVGTFHGGVNFINPSTLKFDSISTKNKSTTCIKNFTIYDVIEDDDNHIWLATENGAVKINKQNKCQIFNHKADDKYTLSGNSILSISQTSNGNLWFLNSRGGLDKLSEITGKIERIGEQFKDISSHFLIEENENELILGSFRNGLFSYNIKKNKLNKFKNIDEKFNKASFFIYAIDKNNDYYFGTEKGVVKFNENNELKAVNINFSEDKDYEVNALAFDKAGDLWIGVNNQYLLKKNKNGKTENITDKLVTDDKPLKVLSIIPTDENTLWISSNKGIYKINTETYEYWHFTAQDGLQDTEYVKKSYHYSKSGKIYFGGKKGVNSFYPEEISINEVPPQTVLTSFNHFNKKLEVGIETKSQFKLKKPINYMDELKLGYKDYIIGFEFAALDYADSMRNKYAYRLLGLNDDWVYVDANDRKATYTNLNSGDYIFQVKAANKDGVWNETPKELKIKVSPAPWLTPWAYLAYFVITIISIWGFIRYKTIASRKRAQQLEVTVAARTHEVKLQKKMVESLLDHKNEVFANVTHEFKTPLALILGPAEQLAKKPEYVKGSDELNMIQRNAKRLMLMVGQILKLSQAELDKEVIRESQALKPILTMLYESFKPLAEDKNISIILDNKYDVNVHATSECLEIVIGNLLSNALKFTNSGGEIYISSELKDDQVSISVKDTGSGIDKKDLDKVFKRFTRLDTHKSIQGTGIGLSVVKEITEANDGQVVVESEWGKGSEFKVIFPVTDIIANEELSQVMVDQLVGNTENELSVEIKNQNNKQVADKNRVTVLIIEDNLDMQTHIGNVLKGRFDCLFADRGRVGISIALKDVPDIVICDVMMPGMDGYQVTRILRHDSRTSHIPIILLTALNTKESRIKGWRENIDVYVTKPFDATELNVQLDNVLTIRRILQKQTNKVIKSNGLIDTLDLSKQDLKFIEKLKDIIGTHYGNEYFQVADLASKMAVSDRQLQRKVRALIGETPMDMLRDYRLEKAAIKLKEGYQINLVGDKCGFSSASYFSTCFKKKYGVTPKKYQMLK